MSERAESRKEPERLLAGSALVVRNEQREVA
jgi:hypothetical protein